MDGGAEKSAMELSIESSYCPQWSSNADDGVVSMPLPSKCDDGAFAATALGVVSSSPSIASSSSKVSTMVLSSKMFAQKLRSYDSLSPSSFAAALVRWFELEADGIDEGSTGAWLADATTEFDGCAWVCVWSSARDDKENDPDEFIVGDAIDDDVLEEEAEENDVDFICVAVG